MRLCFLLERQYAPYSKWFGTASRSSTRPRSSRRSSKAASLAWPMKRSRCRHNALGITDPVEPTLRPYYGRPFLVIRGERFVTAVSRRCKTPG